MRLAFAVHVLLCILALVFGKPSPKKEALEKIKGLSEMVYAYLVQYTAINTGLNNRKSTLS
jgi:hypothetical protein